MDNFLVIFTVKFLPKKLFFLSKNHLSSFVHGFSFSTVNFSSPSSIPKLSSPSLPGKIFRKREKLKAWRSSFHKPSIGSMMPNMITLSALCMGLSSIRFSLTGQWKQAVASILIAALLDGLDGRLARLLNTSSDFGAELDSLVDFVNFGIAPILLLYIYRLRFLGNGNIGWILCLLFSACMALRLARFNVQRTSPTFSKLFSVGVAAPFGALMVLSPLVFYFITNHHSSPFFLGFVVCLTAFLLVSPYPTFVFKKIYFPPQYRPMALLGVLLFVIFSVTSPWETLFGFCCLYILSLPISGYLFYKKKLK